MTAAPDVRRVVLGALLVRAGQSLNVRADLAEIAAETGLSVDQVGGALAEFDAEGFLFATVSPAGSAVTAWIS